MEYRQQPNFQVVEPVVDGDGDDGEAFPSGISVSKFDYSVENHFKVIEKIGVLSGESEIEYEQTEIQRLSSSVTFLRKWRDFRYQSRAIKFACENETPLEKDVTARMDLPQFSSAAVSKDMPNVNESSSPSSKDFVMYVGGHVWALDWCPRFHQSSEFENNVEFLAVSAHPPESSYHKIGAPLTGRGLIQIWCLLNNVAKNQDLTSLVKVKIKVKPRSYSTNNNKLHKPRGRPRKNTLNESTHKMDDINQIVQDPAVESKNLLQVVTVDETDKKIRSCNSKKPRGRPKKKPIMESVNNLFKTSPQPLAVEFPENSHKSTILTPETVATEDKSRKKRITESINISPKTSPQPLALEFPENSHKITILPPEKDVTEDKSRKKRITESINNSPKTSPQPLALEFPANSNKITILTPQTVGNEDKSRKKRITESINNSPKTSPQPLALEFLENSHKITILTPETVDKEDKFKKKPTEEVKLKVYNRKRKNYNEGDSEKSKSKSRLSKCQTKVNVVLPRLVMGLAHNGKVAWDVKWRPCDSNEISKHIMGYLAVLLGNGALEVWEVPLPRVTKAIFSSCHEEGTDPRFLKLKPVFICSRLKCGDRQSIPLTLEWSTSAPHDLILAGCHDGVVALWRFSANGPSKDTRPLLCFSADTVPIRALKWAPMASDPESANIFVTAGHKGLKFWDIRDPFHPLWDIPTQKIINSLDWVADPRCVVLSVDDGEIRIISLLMAACETPVTGLSCVKTQQHGSHSYYCSSSSIWSVQVSRITGMVAYCCSDGKVIHFQLTKKAVEKDPRRNGEPHYLCGSVAEEEESSLTVLSPLPNVPFLMKKSSNEWGNIPRSQRKFKSIANQENRAKEQISKLQTQQKQPSGHKSDTSKTETSQALVCIDVDNTIEEKNVNEDEKLGFPSKIVAMHRVRWNTNKGSERLLCYGGASGIVRCQHIN